MDVIVGGYIPTSFLDYPGNTAAVLFLPGCQFRCPFCHNPELVTLSEKTERLSVKDILADLEKRRKFLDGVCVTGGEPTLQRDLLTFLLKIRSTGLKIKLDTNGARPDMLERILAAGAVNYVAMDVKAPAEKYSLASGWNGDIFLVEKSISLLLHCGVPFEFRTTLVPGIHTLEDAQALGRMVEGAPLFVLQNFRPGHTLDPFFTDKTSFHAEFLEAFREEVRSFVGEVRIRE